MQQKTSLSDDYKDQSKLAQLCWDVASVIDVVYQHFNIDISYQNHQMIKSVCPVHGGDNRVACNMYPNGDHVAHWKCRTHGCEEHFGKTMIGFIKGCLSRTKYQWEKIGDQEASFKETIDFMLHITGQKLSDIDGQSSTYIEMSKFSSMIWGMVSDNDHTQTNITRDYFRNNIEIPSQYYLDRGYSKEILDKYDVGFCSTKGKPLYNRAIFPIYNEDQSYIVGFTGRSIFDKCNKCKFYHDPNDRCKFFPKWKHSKGFVKEKWLYNYWYAKDFVKDTKTVILVESPGNVWRLEEAGIHNSVAIFGTALNDQQKDLLDNLGAMGIIIMMDNDDAGRNASEKITKMCSNQYRIYEPEINRNDIGDIKDYQYLRNLVNPFIYEVKEYYS